MLDADFLNLPPEQEGRARQLFAEYRARGIDRRRAIRDFEEAEFSVSVIGNCVCRAIDSRTFTFRFSIFHIFVNRHKGTRVTSKFETQSLKVTRDGNHGRGEFEGSINKTRIIYKISKEEC